MLFLHQTRVHASGLYCRCSGQLYPCQALVFEWIIRIVVHMPFIQELMQFSAHSLCHSGLFQWFTVAFVRFAILSHLPSSRHWLSRLLTFKRLPHQSLLGVPSSIGFVTFGNGLFSRGRPPLKNSLPNYALPKIIPLAACAGPQWLLLPLLVVMSVWQQIFLAEDHFLKGSLSDFTKAANSFIISDFQYQHLPFLIGPSTLPTMPLT